MPDQAKRLSVLAQTVDLIREGILSGRWMKQLPQERLLCEELNVSRSTIRRALPKLEEMGMIASAQRGVRRKILSQPLPKQPNIKQPSPKNSHQIAWLTGEEPMRLPSFIKGLYMDIQKRLERHNCELRIITLPHKPLNHPDKYLADWIKDFPRDAWILHSMPDLVQQWFSKHQPNAFLFGNRAQDVTLGGISIDSKPAIQHATNKLRQLGHKRIGLVRKEETLVGEQQVEDAFMSSLSEEEQIHSSLLYCPNDPGMTRHVLEKTFHSSRGSHPTALFCTVPHLAYAALTWLQQHGFAIPEQVSIVLLRTQPLLEFCSPSLAHYGINESRIGPAALPALLDLAQTGSCSDTEISLVPEFYPGDSLGIPPKDVS